MRFWEALTGRKIAEYRTDGQVWGMCSLTDTDEDDESNVASPGAAAAAAAWADFDAPFSAGGTRSARVAAGTVEGTIHVLQFRPATAAREASAVLLRKWTAPDRPGRGRDRVQAMAGLSGTELVTGHLSGALHVWNWAPQLSRPPPLAAADAGDGAEVGGAAGGGAAGATTDGRVHGHARAAATTAATAAADLCRRNRWRSVLLKTRGQEESVKLTKSAVAAAVSEATGTDARLGRQLLKDLKLDDHKPTGAGDRTIARA